VASGAFLRRLAADGHVDDRAAGVQTAGIGITIGGEGDRRPANHQNHHYS
jgi:hypothetical protein